MQDEVIWSSEGDYKIWDEEAFCRCYKGGSKPKPPPPPSPPPARQTAAESMGVKRINERRIKARGFESTILTSGSGVAEPAKLSLGSSPLFKKLFGS